MSLINNRSRFGLVALALLSAVVVARAWFSLGSPPQLPPRSEVFKTVDSLFTSITARDEAQLTACEQRLADQAQQGLLPPAASKRLFRAIDAARDGQWESAAKQLYSFMEGQRRQ